MSLKFVAIGGGIIVSFWVAGLLQERLYKGTYGSAREKFTFVLSLIFMTTAVNCLYSFTMVKIRRIPSTHNVPAQYQYSIAVAYLLSMYCSQAALKWVSYPAQVLAKSAKPIPVLILGVLVGKRSYHRARYVSVMMLVVGIVLFTYRDDKAAQSDVGFGFGELLLLAALLLDGILNSLEERVMAEHTVASDRFMLDINVAAIFFLGIALVSSREIFHFACFAQKHPVVLWHMLTVCFCSAVGQFCVFKCITNFGTLTCSIVTTSRKFFTVLSSILIFGHILQLRQWIGIICVFGGLTLDIYFGKFKAVQRQSLDA